MTITINSNNSISINGASTGLYVTQRASGTVVYSAGHGGKDYKEHAMPHARYSLSHGNPRPMHATPELAAKYKTAGRAQFEADIRALIAGQ